METPYEQTARHVHEGEQRVANQRALIARLEQERHDAMLPVARELLAELEGFLQMAHEHLERKRAKACTAGPGAK